MNQVNCHHLDEVFLLLFEALDLIYNTQRSSRRSHVAQMTKETLTRKFNRNQEHAHATKLNMKNILDEMKTQEYPLTNY